MALEIFKNKENYEELDKNVKYLYPEEYEIFMDNYVNIDHEEDILEIKFQTGPRKEVGINGLQIDILFLIGQQVLKGLNKEFPCKENEIAINLLDDVISTLQKRTKNRIKKGTEGLSK